MIIITTVLEKEGQFGKLYFGQRFVLFPINGVFLWVSSKKLWTRGGV